MDLYGFIPHIDLDVEVRIFGANKSPVPAGPSLWSINRPLVLYSSRKFSLAAPEFTIGQENMEQRKT